MIPQQEIEAYAVQMAAPGFEGSRASVEKLIGHLDEDDQHAVCSRCLQISSERGNEEDAGPITLTEQEIEALGSQLADDWSRGEWDSEVTTGLDDANFNAVLIRAEDIQFDRTVAKGGAEALNSLIRGAEALTRLAHATGCPDDEPVLPWLQEHSCAEEDDGGFRFKMPGLRAVP
jgi:hypothetical protein